MEPTLRLIQDLKQEEEDIGLQGKDVAENVRRQQTLDREERAACRDLQKQKLHAEEKNGSEESHIKIQIAQIEAAKEQAKIEADKELKIKEMELQAQQAEATTSSATTPPPRNKDANLYRQEGRLDSYLLCFECYTENASWEKYTWAVKLSALLTGRAMDVYTRMSDTDAIDYDKVKKALLTRYNYKEDGYQKDSGRSSLRLKKRQASSSSIQGTT